MRDDRGAAEMELPDDRPDVPVDATPEYLAALRDASGRVPVGDVDWDDFHTRLNARAEMALVRLRTANAHTGGLRRSSGAQRRSASWWEYTAMPSRIWRPIAAAAAIAIAAGLHAWTNDGAQLDAIDVVSLASSELTDARGAFESAVIAGTSSGSIATYLVPTSADASSAATRDSSTGK